jgi:hypothetical protein
LQRPPAATSRPGSTKSVTASIGTATDFYDADGELPIQQDPAQVILLGRTRLADCR